MFRAIVLQQDKVFVGRWWGGCRSAAKVSRVGACLDHIPREILLRRRIDRTLLFD
jgi:hypothetical protein